MSEMILQQNKPRKQINRGQRPNFRALIGKKVAPRKVDSLKFAEQEECLLDDPLASVPGVQGQRCGELFVTQNARRWTFVCTFCNKSTRDIGEFICHIKIKHLGQTVNSGSSDESDDTHTETEKFCSEDQDYLDCSNYLDVNVQTESEDLSYSIGRTTPKKIPKLLLEQRDKPTAAAVFHSDKVFTGLETHLSVVDAPDEASQQKLEIKTETVIVGSNGDAYGHQSQLHHENMLDGYRDLKKHIPADQCIKKEASLLCSRSLDNRMKSELDNHNDDGSQLLLPLNTSNMMGNRNESKGKRRQVRGTAFCALCNKTFQYYSLYRNHMTKHSNETPFKCVICKKGFKSKQAIRYHMNTHQRNKKYKCPLCQSEFITESQYTTHIMSHETEATFPCMVCGSVLLSENERDAHLATHTERPFRCEFCNKLFRLRHHLSNHLKMHRMYRCDYCREEFNSATILRKPYACTYCEETQGVKAISRSNYISNICRPPNQGRKGNKNSTNKCERLLQEEKPVSFMECYTSTDSEASSEFIA